MGVSTPDINSTLIGPKWSNLCAFWNYPFCPANSLIGRGPDSQAIAAEEHGVILELEGDRGLWKHWICSDAGRREKHLNKTVKVGDNTSCPLSGTVLCPFNTEPLDSGYGFAVSHV